MKHDSFVLKGNICYARSADRLLVTDGGYLVCYGGKSKGVYPVLPEEYSALPIVDYHDMLIIPGLIDLHLHAPQYTFRGTGMDLELLKWLETYTFPEESLYAQPEYARNAYGIFVDDLQKSATTRAVIFGTIHAEATDFLMERLDASGLKTYVGKVNMDQNSPNMLREKTAEDSLAATKEWLERTLGKYPNAAPILTPRFAPACSPALLEGLGELQQEYGLPVQSHLSENFLEIDLVKQLFPWSGCYGEVYARYGLFGKGAKTVMAHCIHSTDREVDLLKERGIYVAHCPQSNTNLASGIAPIRKYLDLGINIGLGTDMAGGANLSMFRCMADACSVSKLYWRLVDQKFKPLTAEEAFYLATKGGGAFFGNVGSFECGYEFDAVILDDSGMRTARKFSTRDRLERFIHLAQEGGKLAGKYVAGKEIAL